jgi:hypothetical protein
VGQIWKMMNFAGRQPYYPWLASSQVCSQADFWKHNDVNLDLHCIWRAAAWLPQVFNRTQWWCTSRSHSYWLSANVALNLGLPALFLWKGCAKKMGEKPWWSSGKQKRQWECRTVCRWNNMTPIWANPSLRQDWALSWASRENIQ